MSRFNAWNNMLELSKYEKADKTLIQFVDNTQREKIGEPIEIPIPIMYRLYHLGRAYDFQTMKLLRPNSEMVLDRINILELYAEINFLEQVIKDPIITHFIDVLMPILKSVKDIKGAGMVVITPGYK